MGSVENGRRSIIRKRSSSNQGSGSNKKISIATPPSLLSLVTLPTGGKKEFVVFKFDM